MRAIRSPRILVLVAILAASLVPLAGRPASAGPGSLAEAASRLRKAQDDDEAALAVRHLVFHGPATTALLPDLLAAPSWRTRLGAVRTAAFIEQEGAVPLLRGALSDPSWIVRQEAVISFGRRGDLLTETDLEAAVTDPIWAVRAATADALRVLRPPHARELLLRMLDDSDAYVRSRALRSLFLCGWLEGIEACGRGLEDEDPRLRRMAAVALARDPHPASLALLESLTGDDDLDLRLYSGEALLRRGADLETLTELLLLAARSLADPHTASSTRELAGRFLGLSGEPGNLLVEDLARTLSRRQSTGSDAALEPAFLLARLVSARGEAAVATLEAILGDPEAGVSSRASCATLLGNLPGRAGLDALRAALPRENDPLLRIVLLRSLVERARLCESKDFAPFLLEGSGQVRLLALEGLMARDDPGGLEMLGALLATDVGGRPLAATHEAARLVSRAATLPGERGGSILFDLIDHPVAEVRALALSGLGEVALRLDEDVVDGLIARLRVESDPRVLFNLVFTISLTTTKRGVTILEEIARDPERSSDLRRLATRRLAALDEDKLVLLIQELSTPPPVAGSPRANQLTASLLSLALPVKTSTAWVAARLFANEELPEQVRLAALRTGAGEASTDALLGRAEDGKESIELRCESLVPLAQRPLTRDEVSRLLRLATEVTSPEGEDETVRAAVLPALGSSGDSRALEVLRRIVNEGRPESGPASELLFAAAAQALARGGGEEDARLLVGLLLRSLLSSPHPAEDPPTVLDPLLHALRSLASAAAEKAFRKEWAELARCERLPDLSEEALGLLLDRLTRARLDGLAGPILERMRTIPPAHSRLDLAAARRLARMADLRNDLPAAARYHQEAADILFCEDYADAEEDILNGRSPATYHRVAALVFGAEKEEEIAPAERLAQDEPRALLLLASELAEVAPAIAARAARNAEERLPDDAAPLLALATAETVRGNEAEARTALRRAVFKLAAAGERDLAAVLRLAALELRCGGKSGARDLLLAESDRIPGGLAGALSSESSLPASDRKALQALLGPQGTR